MQQISPLRGVTLVLLAALLWGTTGTAQSFAPPALEAYWVGALRLLAAAVFFLAWLVLMPGRARVPGALVALPWRFITAAAACMCIYNLAFFAGVRASGVAVGTAIALGSGPIWAGLLQMLHGGRAPALAWWGGTALAVAGGGLMIISPDAVLPLSAWGVGLCLLAGLSYALFALLNKHLVSRAPASVVTAAVFTLAAALALPAAAALAGPLHMTDRDWLIIAWLGVMSTGVAYLLFSHGLRHISGATGVALALAEPVIAFALAVLVVGERPGWLALAGLAGVLAGLGLVIRAEVRAAAGATKSQHPVS